MDWEDSGAIRRLFHGDISREEAEERLLRHAAAHTSGSGEGLYLARANPRNSYSLILSFTALKPARRQAQKDESAYEEQRDVPLSSELKLGVTHWQVNVNRYSKVEGFFFINKPNCVSLTFDGLLADAASAQARSPLLRPEGEAVQSAWWEELILWRTDDVHYPGSPLYTLPDDLVVGVFLLLPDRSCLAALHLVCKRFYALARDSSVWRTLYRRDFGRRVPQVQLAASDIDWKLKYYLDRTLLTADNEPRVVGLSVASGSPSRSTSLSDTEGRGSYHVEYSTEEPNVFHFVSNPAILSKARCSAETLLTGRIAIYRIKSGYKAGYSLERDPASLGSIYPSLQKLITYIRTYMCLMDPYPLAFLLPPALVDAE